MSAAAQILLVDDDRDLVATLRLVLEKQGYGVLAAHDAQTGLALAAAQHPDLILLDVMMPNATEGFHLVWDLRRHHDPYLHTVPIILMTAIHERTTLRFYPDSGDGTYQAGEYLPVEGFLDKPVDPAELLARVAGALSVGARR
jgi:DNA-binding response OmpR family regulator